MPHFSELKTKEVLPGFTGRFVHGEQSSLAIWQIRKGSTMPEHFHVHEQITYILEGTIEMTIGGKDYLFSAGDVHVIPSLVPHSAIAREDCRVVDSFSPAREEYR